MDATITKIARMLEHDEAEKRYAAAVVLAELRVKEYALIEPLGRCLQEESRLLRIAALQALAVLQDPDVAELVLPLLDDPDETIRARAAAVLGAHGASAWEAFTRELEGAPMARQRLIFSILVRDHTVRNMDRVLPFLETAGVGEALLAALRPEVDHMDHRTRGAVAKRVLDLLTRPVFANDPSRVARGLRALGLLRTGPLVEQILPYVGDRRPLTVRLAAITALRRPLQACRGKGQTAEAFLTLLQAARDANATVARAAVDTLTGLPVPHGAMTDLLELTASPHAEVRSFSLAALGNMGDTKATEILLDHLDGDPASREAAVGALASMPEASPRLVKALQAAAPDENTTRTAALCRVLAQHGPALSERDRKTVASVTFQAVEERWAAAPEFIALLAAVEPESYAQKLAARARRHQNADRHEVAFTLLRQVDEAGLLDEAGRYAAVVSGLLMRKLNGTPTRADRRTDPVLRHVGPLLEQGFPLSTKLCAERKLCEEHLFHVGFNFAESPDDDEKELAGDLLAHLATTAPSSKLGKAARNKLRLMGEEYLEAYGL